MTTTQFIGIDLAWKSDRNPTGAVCLQGDRSGADLVAVAPPLWTADQVLQFVRANAGPESVVAVDAPLIIANASGQRPCETLVSRRYGSRDASCHTTNLNLYPSASSVALARSIQATGFAHVESAAPLAARAFAEVYPHAGMVALFDLPKIIKYKKGTVDEKRTGLEALRSLLASLLHAEPRVVDSDMLRSLLGKGLDGLRRQELKAYEDSLDALFCGYLAYYVWYWGWTKNEVFGEVRTGYIMNPKLVPGGVGRAA